MADPVTDVVALLRLALDSLSCNTGDCCPVSPPTCRTAVYLAGEVPWDTCESGCSGDSNGMMWANLLTIAPTAGGSDQGSCADYIWTAEVGIVRCVAGPTNDGSPPSADKVQADAEQQATDADAIFTALRCCDSRPEGLLDVALSSWAPLGPNGNCAGGAWTVRGRLSVCCG